MVEKRKEEKKPLPDKVSASAEPWVSKRTGALLMLLLTLGVFGLVWFSAPEGADLGTTLKVAVVMTLAMWVVFGFVFTISRWLHSR